MEILASFYCILGQELDGIT